MKATSFLLPLILSFIVFTSCKENNNIKSLESDSDAPEKKTIVMVKLKNSPAYVDATLMLGIPDIIQLDEPGSIDFNFGIENFDLGKQTESANAKILANSGKGQHIHFILNNQPYSAHYTNTFQKDIKEEGVYHLVAFLSRSYHESVKNDNSIVVRKVEVGKNLQQESDLDMNAPTLIYSRPKGKYVGSDANNILLDFFVLNTKLSKTDSKVRATINEEVFMITDWVPHVLQNLPMGEVTIKLELLDNHDKLIPGPFNSVTRTIILEE